MIFDFAKAEAYGKALSHPVRLKFLALARTQPTSPVMASRESEDTSLGVVSYHVGALESWGCVELAEMRPRRGTMEHLYSLTPRGADVLELAEALTDDATWR